MAICALYFALIAFYPGLALIVPVMLIYAAAFGAYQAVAWALALKVLPSAEAAGKDMGIWHISMVLPQILGPAVTAFGRDVIEKETPCCYGVELHAHKITLS